MIERLRFTDHARAAACKGGVHALVQQHRECKICLALLACVHAADDLRLRNPLPVLDGKRAHVMPLLVDARGTVHVNDADQTGVRHAERLDRLRRTRVGLTVRLSVKHGLAMDGADAHIVELLRKPCPYCYHTVRAVRAARKLLVPRFQPQRALAVVALSRMRMYDQHADAAARCGDQASRLHHTLHIDSPVGLIDGVLYCTDIHGHDGCRTRRHDRIIVSVGVKRQRLLLAALFGALLGLLRVTILRQGRQRTVKLPALLSAVGGGRLHTAPRHQKHGKRDQHRRNDRCRSHGQPLGQSACARAQVTDHARILPRTHLAP